MMQHPQHFDIFFFFLATTEINDIIILPFFLFHTNIMSDS